MAICEQFPHGFNNNHQPKRFVCSYLNAKLCYVVIDADRTKKKKLRSYYNLMIKCKMWLHVIRSNLIQWPFHPALNCIWDLKQKPLSRFQVFSAAKTFPTYDITSSTVSVGGMSLWSTWPDWNIHFLHVTHRLRQRHIHTNTLPRFRVITLTKSRFNGRLHTLATFHIFKHSIRLYVELCALKSLGTISLNFSNL